MKSEYKAAGGIFALVVLGGAISAAVFVTVGSQMAVMSVVGIVPVLAVVGFLFVRTTLSGGGSGQSRIRERQARDVGRQFADAYGEWQSMRDAYPELTTDADVSFDGIIADLESEGVSVDRETGTTSLGRFSSPDITTLSSIIDDIESTAERRDEAFVTAVRSEVSEVNSQLRRLDGLVDVDVGEPPEAFDRETGEAADMKWWRALGAELDEHREHAHSEVERAVSAVRRAMRDADDVDESTVESHLSAAESATDVTTAVEETLAARDQFRSEAGESFSDRRHELLALSDAVESSDVESHVPAAEYESFAEAADAVRELDDAMEADELSRRGRELKSACTDLVASLESTLDDQLSTLESADVPDDYYDRPEAAGVDYAAELRDTVATDEYRETWVASVTALTDAVDKLETKERVAGVYDDIAGVIDETLRTQGRVTADDLPIKRDHDQFMGLYARSNDVEFDPTEPSLSAAGGAETHAVTVTAAFSEGGSERSATVELSGDGHEATETVATYLAEEVTFEDVPYGDYEVRAIPDTDGNETATAQVTVDSDVDVELEMRDVSLRERLCAGVDGVDAILDRMADRLDDRFAEEGHLAASMEFPVDDEYVPCLLATWGTEAGHEVTETDAGVLVYDADRVVDDLRKVARHNLDAGEAMEYGTLRERFLSVPVPDAAVDDAAGRIDALDATTTGITKEDA